MAKSEGKVLRDPQIGDVLIVKSARSRSISIYWWTDYATDYGSGSILNG